MNPLSGREFWVYRALSHLEASSGLFSSSRKTEREGGTAFPHPGAPSASVLLLQLAVRLFPPPHADSLYGFITLQTFELSNFGAVRAADVARAVRTVPVLLVFKNARLCRTQGALFNTGASFFTLALLVFNNVLRS